jgi:hypothetical protein
MKALRVKMALKRGTRQGQGQGKWQQRARHVLHTWTAEVGSFTYNSLL